ncbi:MAG: hypothetical protein GY861_00365 [bacterium]|nr:hypothetical protein [bacterium]
MSDKIQDEDRKAVEEHFAGQRSIDDLTEEQIELAVDMEQAQNNGEVQEAIEEPETKQEPVDNVETKSLNHHQKLAEAMAEANRYKQLNEDKERKLNDLKENEEFRNKFLGIKTEVKVDNERDYLDDQHQATLEAKINALEEREARREEEARTKADELSRKEQQLGIFGEISNLQDTHKILKTTESFQSIDKKFVDWQAISKANGVDVDEYLANAEYKKQKDAEGFKLDVSQSDLNKAMKIYELHDQYNNEVNAGYKSSITRVFEGSSTYKEHVKNQYSSHRRADDDALNSLIEERSKEVSLLNTGGAPADAGDIGAMLDEQDRLSRKTVMTPEDKKRFNELDVQINLMT